MSRDMAPELAGAAGAPVVYPVLLMEFDFNPEIVALWTGLGNLAWENRMFSGAGDLIGISAIEETAEVRAASTTISLSGVPGAVVDAALDVDYQGYPVTIWLALLNEAGAILGEPLQVLAGRMDTLSYSEGETATLSLTVENQLVDLGRPRVRRYTDADQQAEYPGDLGLQFVTSLIEKEITWGRR